MKYITLNDILIVIDQATLNDVIENNNSLLDSAEASVLDEAYGYLNIRYDAEVELAKTGTERHATLVEKIVDIMLYNLHSRISPDNIPELRENRYKDALTWLEKISSGFINPRLTVKTKNPTTPIRYGSSSPKQNPYY